MYCVDYEKNPSYNCHLNVVEGFKRPNDSRSRVLGGLVVSQRKQVGMGIDKTFTIPFSILFYHSILYRFSYLFSFGKMDNKQVD